MKLSLCNFYVKKYIIFLIFELHILGTVVSKLTTFPALAHSNHCFIHAQMHKFLFPEVVCLHVGVPGLSFLLADALF